jgi:hypothetical protein
MRRLSDRQAYLHQVHVWHDGLDLLDRLCLLSGIDLGQVDVEQGLLLRLLLRSRRCFGRWACSGSGSGRRYRRRI